MNRLQNWGNIFIRISLGVSLIASAFYNSYLVPDIPSSSLHMQGFLIPTLYALGMLLILGLFTRLSSLFGLIILTIFYNSNGFGKIDLIYYFGAYILLFLTGSEKYSLDRVFFGDRKSADKYLNLKILITRLIFGTSLLFWNGFQPWVSLIGICIAVGIFTRFAAITLLILFFSLLILPKEPFWTQLVLLTLALNFVINNGGNYTINRLVENRFFAKNKKKNNQR